MSLGRHNRTGAGDEAIHYLVTRQHAFTLVRWVDHYADQLDGRLRILPYEHVCGRLRPATYIFSDIERLLPRATARAARIWDALHCAGANLLNHPVHSLRRYDLMASIDNDFRVFRPGERPQQLRYPVFLRNENDHRGSLTPLLHTPTELDRARRLHPHALLVEYVDTRGADGFYRKYSVTRIGGAIVPRHILFSKHWQVKGPDLVDDAKLAEEMEYVRTNPHEKRLQEIFQCARIEYGRIDYGVKDGRLQIWEINTNPFMGTGADARLPIRRQIHAFVAKLINDALLALTPSESTNQQAGVYAGAWRVPPWRSQVVR